MGQPDMIDFTNSNDALKPGKLRFFHRFHNLSPEDLITVAGQMRVYHLDRGARLTGNGTEDEVFLLAGEVVISGRKVKKVVKAGSEAARTPLDLGSAGQFELRAISPAAYVRFPRGLMSGLKCWKGENGTAKADPNWDARLLADLASGSIALPAMPRVAVRIQQEASREGTDYNRVAKLVELDPAIAGKFIKVANSPIFRRRTAVDTVAGAIARLGLHTTRELVICFSLRDVFVTKNVILKARMQRVWQHSLDVAAIATVLAEILPDFNASRALLCGLLHDCGTLAILKYLENMPQIYTNRDRLNQTIEHHKQIGSLILRDWNLGDDLQAAAAHAGDWMYEGGTAPNYVDIVIIAKMHALLKTEASVELPRIDATPAFRKLGLGKLTPELTVLVLEEAQSKIDEARALLAA